MNLVQQYVKAGYSVIPVKKGEKRPAIMKWQKFCDKPATEKQLADWKDKYGDHNVGLALGTQHGGAQLICIDIDDEEMVGPVVGALGADTPGKKGKKGLTIFALAPIEMKNKKIKRRDENGKALPNPSVEILCHGSQTVIPPSMHPDGMAYEWIGPSLLDVGTDMPQVTDATIDEIEAFCHNKNEHFDNLNTMHWAGNDGGGNTHDTCLAAAAFLVARGWADPDIHTRIERAKREACERAGDKYNWPGSTKAIQGWIDSAREKGMSNRVSAKKIPPERMMADWLLDKCGGEEFVATVDGVMRRYKSGYWPTVNVPILMREMYRDNPILKEREAKSAVSIAHTLTQRDEFARTAGVKEPKNDPKRQRVCLKNGSINLRTGTLEQHDPDHEILHQLDFDWDDEATCPTYERVIEETFDGDKQAIKLWDEYCAHTLVDDMSFQKLLFLKGPGGNGKGTLARVLRSMHDPSAVGSVGITDLNDERKRTSLVGKLINISGEQSRLNLVSDTYLKKITGGDPVDVRKLYGETKNNVELSVRFLELVNEMPSTSDNSHALRRRIIILPCPNKINNPDLDLDSKLSVERAGILRRWIDALQNLYERGSFDIPKASEEEVNRYMIENDMVGYWLENCCDPVEDGEKGKPSRELYGHFREWATEMGFRNPLAEIYWGKRMIAHGYPAKNARLGKVTVRTRDVTIRGGFN